MAADATKERRVRLSATEKFALGLDDSSDEDTTNENNSELSEIDQHHHRHHKESIKLWRRRLFAMGWIYALHAYRGITTTLLKVFFPVIVLFIFIMSITYHFHWEMSGTAKIELTKDAQASEYNGGTDIVRVRGFFAANELICHKHSGGLLAESYIIFTPKNDFTEEFMTKVAENLGITNQGYGVDSEIILKQHCRTHFLKWSKNSSGSGLAPIGLIFKLDDKLSNHDNKPFMKNDYFSHTFSYTIRTFLQEVANTKELHPYYKTLKKEQNLSPYVGSGFLGIQNAIDFAYMQMIAQEKIEANRRDAQRTRDTVDQTLRKFKYRMFPFPVYLDLKARNSVWFLLVLALVLGNFFTTIHQCSQIIKDKESGILELLQLHGLSTSIHWTSTLLQDFISRGLQDALLTVILLSSITNVAFLQYQNGLVWVVLYIHGFAQGSFRYFTSLLFSGATFGAITSCFISLVTFIAPMTIYSTGFNLGKFFNAILCFLFPNWCLANALYNFLKFESYDTGVHISLFARYADQRRIILPEGACLIVFCLSTMSYHLLTIYVDEVQKKQFMPNKSYFYWLKRKDQQKLGDEEDDEVIKREVNDDDFDEKPVVYESVQNAKVTIKCRHVSHVNSGILQVLDNVNLNIYEGEVTLFLGNSGSGKSALLRCLGGILKPINGYVLLGNEPIFGNLPLLQETIGFCFEPHLFYDFLAVEEHIQLCCLLHGNEYQITKRQCVALLLRFNLYSARNSSIKSLSQLDKRKLSIAMALANNPKVLILDHPTQGMDSSEVHEIWRVVRVCSKFEQKGLRKQRTIIATATTMDEGDLYADRIGVMANGRLLSFSSSSFLKTTLKIGPYLKLSKAEDKEIDVSGVMKTIQGVIGSTSQVTASQVRMKAFEQIDNHTYFSIPPKMIMSKVIQALEQKSVDLGIEKIGVMHLTLAGILKDLTQLNGIELENIGAFFPAISSNPYENIKIPVQLPQLPAGVKKIPNTFSTVTALFTKQILFIRQKHRFYWIESLFPLIMAFIVVYLTEFYIWSQAVEESLLLSANTYSLPSIPVYLDNVPAQKNGLLSIVGAERLLLLGQDTNDREKFFETLKPSEVSPVDYQAQVAIALSTDKDYTAFYASNSLHAAPCAHNFLTNFILYSFTDDIRKDTNPYRVNAYNHPFPVYEGQASGTSGDVTNAAVGCLMSLILALIAASKITLPLLDRVTGCKSIQFVAGVSPLQYWMVLTICDAIFNFTIAVLLIAVTSIADVCSRNAFIGLDSKLTLMVVITAYLCCASLPFSYLLSKITSDQLSGYSQFVLIHILLGILPQLGTYILFYELPYGIRVTAEGILSLLPSYTMTGALIRYIQITVERNYCLGMPLESHEICLTYGNAPSDAVTLELISGDHYFKSCCLKFCTAAGTCYKKPPFFVTTWEIPLNLITCINVMCLQGVFYLLVLLALDYNVVQSIWSFIHLHLVGDVETARLHLFREVEADTITEATVYTEVERIETFISDGPSDEVSDLFYVRNITKLRRNKEVLSHVYFGVPPGSVLGIMGIAYSGKTTLARIIVGDLRPNLGYCVISPNYRIDQNRKNYLNKISYASQLNSVLPHLTGFQMMQLIGRIRGIPVDYLDIHCKKWLELLRFTPKEMVTHTSLYEKCQQRLLCCAMALLGNCDLLVLDEPTANLDDVSQQSLWSVIQLAKLNGQSIIFTSITAQECSDNSTKMIILEDGKVKAVGSPSLIKNEYASGWTLVVRFKNNLATKYSKGDIDNKQLQVKEYIDEMYSPCELKDSNGSLLVYHVKEKQPLSQMYACMETIASDMSEIINDFLIDESSLDDIMGYFGGSVNQRMKLPSFSSSGDDSSTGSTSNEILDGMESAELSEQNNLKWEGLKKRQSLSPQPSQSISNDNLNTHFSNIVKKNQLVNKSVQKLKENRQSRGVTESTTYQPRRKSIFAQKLTRNENIFKYLQKKTLEVEKHKPAHHPHARAGN